VENIRTAYSSSPLGVIEVVGTETAILSVHFTLRRKAETSEWTPALEACLRELAEYFAGTRKVFTLKLRPAGTDFQRDVWTALGRIPFGTTASYAEVARDIGRPRAVRAVGAANGRNPIAILIPCHRVVGSGGDLVGYGGGLWRKAWLRAHERGKADPDGPLFRKRISRKA
jgi:methylated-DNA-[protein]-cysteine S-methyltransferase